MSELDTALGAFALALVVAWIATPIAGRMAWRVGAIDRPRERGLHVFPTPRLGGLAILIAFATSALIFLEPNEELRGILGGAIVIALVGAADDLLELSPDVKLLGQTLAAVIPVASGVYVADFTAPFVGRVDLGDFGYPATVVGIVAVMNIVNFIDGVDGLAAGICTIAAITFGVIALSLDRNTAGILAAATAGSALGYLRHGFHPATI
ncbi:MAG TPA: MraY family glycosyltransferase, partial [Thermoleophilaceae bacterium]|nr:MraY family glycosyltransferase [Thermoleophilaceae bacterium]